jgi:hypothetical protein
VRRGEGNFQKLPWGSKGVLSLFEFGSVRRAIGDQEKSIIWEQATDQKLDRRPKANSMAVSFCRRRRRRRGRRRPVAAMLKRKKKEKNKKK